MPPEVRFVGRIEIGAPTPSQNVLKRRYRSPHAYKKLRSQLQQWVMVGMVNGGIPPAEGRRRLVIQRYARGKRYLLDRGNLIGGCKPLLDAAILQD